MQIEYFTDADWCDPHKSKLQNRRHLVCVPYSIANLHAMAKDLGIGRHFFHLTPVCHYDIPALRIAEVAKRCTRVSSKTIIKITRNI